MNAADPPRSSNGGGCPQQTNSAQDPPAWPASPVPGRSSGIGKFTSSAVTNRSGCSERAIMACSRTAMPARLGSAQARSRQAFSTDRPVRLAGRPLPMTSPTSRRTPNGVASTSWISPPPPLVAGRWRDSTYSRPTCVETGRVMVGSPGGNSIDCSQPTTTCCANREVPATASQTPGRAARTWAHFVPNGARNLTGKSPRRKWARGSGPGPAAVIGPGQGRYWVTRPR